MAKLDLNWWQAIYSLKGKPINSEHINVVNYWVGLQNMHQITLLKSENVWILNHLWLLEFWIENFELVVGERWWGYEMMGVWHDMAVVKDRASWGWGDPWCCRSLRGEREKPTRGGPGYKRNWLADLSICRNLLKGYWVRAKVLVGEKNEAQASEPEKLPKSPTELVR